MPLSDGQQVLESGKPAAEQPGVTYKGTSNGVAVYETGSGSYRFLAAVSTRRASTAASARSSRRRSR